MKLLDVVSDYMGALETHLISLEVSSPLLELLSTFKEIIGCRYVLEHLIEVQNSIGDQHCELRGLFTTLISQSRIKRQY